MREAVRVFGRDLVQDVDGLLSSESSKGGLTDASSSSEAHRDEFDCELAPSA